MLNTLGSREYALGAFRYRELTNLDITVTPTV